MDNNEGTRIYVSEHFKTSVVAVDEYSEEIFIAKLFNPFYGRIVEIRSYHQLLKELDNLMNELGCPMSGMGKRSFLKHEVETERDVKMAEDITVPKGKIATFAIRMQYRNNASWQGNVKWLEGDSEEYFRSMLDLFWLMDSAMVTES